MNPEELQSIITGIYKIDSYTDYKDVVYALKEVKKNFAENQRRSFSIGDHVGWKHNYSMLTGVVEKVNPKTIGVAQDGGRYHWRITPLLLTKVFVNQEEEKHEKPEQKTEEGINFSS